MPLLQARGGIPLYQTVDIDTTGRRVGMIKPGDGYAANIFWLNIRNKGTQDVRLYFTEADYDADAGAALATGRFIEIGSATAADPYGEWWGPVELDPDDCGIWLRSTSGTQSMEVVGYQRRG